MATHSSILAWKIWGIGQPGGLLSVGSHRVVHDWSNLAATAVAATCNAGGPSSIPELGRSREGIGYPLQCSWAFLVAQLVKNLPVMRETWVWSLDWEDLLEKGKVTHCSILAWRILGLYSPWGCKESDTTQWLSLSCCCMYPYFYLFNWCKAFYCLDVFNLSSPLFTFLAVTGVAKKFVQFFPMVAL